MDIVKDINGNVVNVGDTIKFLYYEAYKFKDRKYITSKISKIDYENKEIILENGYSCRYNILSDWEKEHLDKDLKSRCATDRVGGEKIFID